MTYSSKTAALLAVKNKNKKMVNLRRGEGPRGGMYGGLGSKGLLNGSKGFGPCGLGGANNGFLSNCSVAAATAAASVAGLLCIKSIGVDPGAGLFCPV